jgi:FixJ family two-component response regulator
MMNSRADSFVFIIHGESDVRQNLSNLVKTVGLQTETFVTGEEFLAAYEPDRPGCVVMDLHLPRMSGLEVLHGLRKKAPPIPVIILAAQPTLGDAIDAFRAGATDFFVQPVNSGTLVQCIQAAIASDLPRRRHYLHWLEVQSRMQRLTPPELEVVQLLTEGLLNKQIAARLNVAVRTIELRRANIFRKMEVSSLGDLLRLVIFLEIYSRGTPND